MCHDLDHPIFLLGKPWIIKCFHISKIIFPIIYRLRPPENDAGIYYSALPSRVLMHLYKHHYCRQSYRKPGLKYGLRDPTFSRDHMRSVHALFRLSYNCSLLSAQFWLRKVSCSYALISIPPNCFKNCFSNEC